MNLMGCGLYIIIIVQEVRTVTDLLINSVDVRTVSASSAVHASDTVIVCSSI